MKNMDKYKTPQDKIIAWREWAYSKSGCKACKIGHHDEEEMSAYLQKKLHMIIVAKPILFCDKSICFNAWLCSTAKEKKGDK